MERRLSDQIRFTAATFFGLGCVPFAPGTFGTLGAVLAYAVIATCAGPALSIVLVLATLAAATALSVALAGWASRRWGRPDPSSFVLDEVAGYFAAVAVFPGGALLPTLAVTFLAFRFFDIAKPPPIRNLERLPGGWGVVADDLGAGVAAGLVARLAWLLAAFF